MAKQILIHLGENHPSVVLNLIGGLRGIKYNILIDEHDKPMPIQTKPSPFRAKTKEKT